MRGGWLVLLAACGSKKEPAPAPAPSGSAPQPVIVVDASTADAAPQLVDLFRTVPIAIEVSSRVQNPAIKLAHLVDRDLSTAWNSRTGELAGTWIEIGVPKTATAHEIRMTVGHTGKGPKGEDYFAMNHRISQVSIHVDDKKIATERLDPDNRGLQTIPIPARVRGAQLKIVVDATVPGSKKRWTEVCISELELWGMADQPVAGVKPRVFESSNNVVQSLCEGLVKDPSYPECTVFVPGFEVPDPWQAVGVQDLVTSRVEHHGHLYSETIERRLVLAARGKAWTSDVVSVSSQSDPGTGEDRQDHIEFTIDGVTPVKDGLEIRFTAGPETKRVTCARDQTCTAPGP